MLRVQFDFGTPVQITGMECDYTNNPYTIKIGDNYEQEIITSSGSKSLDEKITVQKIQVGWGSTTGKSIGNGIHFQFLGCPGKFLSLIC